MTTGAVLTLLAVSDAHGVLTDWDYLADRRSASGGSLARAATLVRRIRSDGAPVLMFDVGDSIQGAPMMSLVARNRTGPHPVASVLNLMGVDAACLGNHDLNFGLDALAAYAADCAFPVLAANFQGLPGIQGSTVTAASMGGMGALRVGVIGLSTPGSMIWDAGHLAGRVTVEGIVESARHEVPRLRAAGAELVVVLSHSGLGPSSTYGSALPWPENDTLRLIREVPGIDAVLLGHAHDDEAGHATCEATGALVPYAEPLCFGLRLARIDLHLVRDSDGGVRVARSESRTIPLLGVEPDPAVEAAVRPAHELTVRLLGSTIGTALDAITAVPVEQGPSPCIDLINQVQSAAVETALRGSRYAALPVVSATAMGAVHDGLAPGVIRMADMYRIYRFDNHAHGLVLTGAELRDYLEHNARFFGGHRIPTFNLDSLGAASHVVHYVIDPHAAPGSRVSDLRINGVPLGDEEQVVLCVSDYRASGGGGFPGTAGNPAVYVSEQDVRGLVTEWIAGRGTVTLGDVNRSPWRILAG